MEELRLNHCVAKQLLAQELRSFQPEKWLVPFEISVQFPIAATVGDHGEIQRR